jgi:uncharacterized glyoxalase superfamily protein PhnB
MADVTAHIVVGDAARAAEWYERALGAQIGSRIPVPDGRFMQIELVFGDSQVMIADEFPEDVPQDEIVRRAAELFAAAPPEPSTE